MSRVQRIHATTRFVSSPEKLEPTKIPAWPFLLSVPVSSLVSAAVVMTHTEPTFYPALVVISLLLVGVFGGLCVVAAGVAESVLVALPRLPKRRPRQQKRIDELSARLEEVEAEMRNQPEGHPDREPLGELAGTIKARIGWEVEDVRQRRFVAVTRRANRALDGGR